IPKFSASERGVHAASPSLASKLSLNSNLVGSFTLKRPEGRAPTDRVVIRRGETVCQKSFNRLQVSQRLQGRFASVHSALCRWPGGPILQPCSPIPAPQAARPCPAAREN